MHRIQFLFTFISGATAYTRSQSRNSPRWPASGHIDSIRKTNGRSCAIAYVPRICVRVRTAAFASFFAGGVGAPAMAAVSKGGCEVQVRRSDGGGCGRVQYV